MYHCFLESPNTPTVVRKVSAPQNPERDSGDRLSWMVLLKPFTTCIDVVLLKWVCGVRCYLLLPAPSSDEVMEYFAARSEKKLGGR